MGIKEETYPPSFSILQEKHVNPRILKCCPTMDLIAVYTMDQQLVVYRTISWQKILHVKSAEIGSPITTLCWSPDGYLLATGNEEGEIDMYDIETGKPLSSQYQIPEDTASRHTAKITAMHWISSTSTHSTSSHKRMDSIQSRSSRLGTSVFGSTSSSSWSTSTTTESTMSTTRRSHQQNVLVTADIKGTIHIWFLGRILVTSVTLSQIIQPFSSTDSNKIIETVWMMPDLSQLYLILKSNTSKEFVSVYIPQLQICQEELEVIAQVASEVQFLLSEITLAFRQITTEWKNTTRVFELKMSLMGSLYEKYDYEDPPQMDMLSLMCSGISSPALAQYFAQDLSEQSVARMQKTFSTGCQSILSLIEKRLKKCLIGLLFLFSELRGHTKWKTKKFSIYLGLFPKQLTFLLENVQNLLEKNEILKQKIQKTQQDFILLFQWFVEQIRLHTGNKKCSIQDRSRLNFRQLCCFMEQAAEFAKQFQKTSNKNCTNTKNPIETTFGNPVTQFLTKPQPKELITDQITRLRLEWVQLLTQVIQVTPQETSAPSVQRIQHTQHTQHTRGFINDQKIIHSIELGENLQEYHFHCRSSFQTKYKKVVPANDEKEKEQEEEYDDWDDFFLKMLSPNENTNSTTTTTTFTTTNPVERSYPTVVLGLRYLIKNQDQRNEQLILLRKKPTDQKWEVAKMTFPLDTTLIGFDFYGGWSSSSNTNTQQEQITLLYSTTCSSHTGKQKPNQEITTQQLCLQPYDHFNFIPLPEEKTSENSTLIQVLSPSFNDSWPSCAFVSTNCLRRRTLLYPFKSVFSNAQRGIICVLSSVPKILTVLDVNEDENEEEEEEEEEIDENDDPNP